MIRFSVKGEDRTLLGIGLSQENLRRLAEQDDIIFKGETAGVENLDVMIFAFEDDKTAVDALEKRGFLLPSDPDKMFIDPKLEG